MEYYLIYSLKAENISNLKFPLISIKKNTKGFLIEKTWKKQLEGFGYTEILNREPIYFNIQEKKYKVIGSLYK